MFRGGGLVRVNEAADRFASILVAHERLVTHVVFSRR